MNKSEVLKVAEKLSIANSIFNQISSNESVLMQAELLSDLDFDKVCFAIENYLKTNKTGRPPTPAHIRDFINPILSPKEIALEAAFKIQNAVSKFGYNWEEGYWSPNGNYWQVNGKTFFSFQEAAKEYLGPSGWNYICSKGGWQNVRNSIQQMPEGIFTAQARDFIESKLKQEECEWNKIFLSYPENKKQISYTESETLPISLMSDEKYF